MATITRSRPTTEARSGGKILKSRRVSAKTPYDRPKVTRQASAVNPGLFANFILPASRKIASGAGKLISTVLGSDSSSSSSSSSSSGSDSGSEDDVECANDENDYPSQGAGWLNKKNGTPSEMIKCFSDERQPVVGKTETKRVIEQLIMQVTFSREECDRLIEIIKLRTVHLPTTEGDADMLNTCNTAVREAKKWLEEKRSGSNSRLESDLGNAVTLSCVTEGDVASPVDMAKSYMQTRPPWASPSVNIEFRNSSPIAMNSFIEETPYTVGCSSLPISKLKRDSPASGSWNMQEELRRVRSRATADLLKNLPSSKIDLSAFDPEHKISEHVLPCDKVETGNGVESCSLNLLTANKSTDVSLNLVTEVDECQDFQDLGVVRNGLPNDVMPSHHTSSIFDANQGVEASKILDGREYAASESPRSGIPNLASKPHDDTRSNDTEHLPSKEIPASRGTESAHGLPSPVSSSYAETDVEPNPKPSKEEQPVDSSHDNVTANVTVEETCELLSEASMEIPTGGSHSTLSMDVVELSQEDPIRVNSKQSVVGKVDRKLKQQQGQKRGRYTRSRGGK